MSKSTETFSSEFINVQIKQEKDDDEHVCYVCVPQISFTSAKDKILHNFFTHANVTSLLETSESVEPVVEPKVEKKFVIRKRGPRNPIKPAAPQKPRDPPLIVFPSAPPSSLNPNPIRECDQCDFSTKFKNKIIKHMLVRHKLIIRPKRVRPPPTGDDRVCLVCGQTLDRHGSLKKHYVTMHDELLGIKKVSDVNYEKIKSKLEKLKKAGKWIEPTKKIPVKRTKKYRHFEASSESSDEDVEEYYKNYQEKDGNNFEYFSSSDDYEEVSRTLQKTCKTCGRSYLTNRALDKHIKVHEKQKNLKNEENS